MEQLHESNGKLQVRNIGYQGNQIWGASFWHCKAAACHHNPGHGTDFNYEFGTKAPLDICKQKNLQVLRGMGTSLNGSRTWPK